MPSSEVAIGRRMKGSETLIGALVLAVQMAAPGRHGEALGAGAVLGGAGDGPVWPFSSPSPCRRRRRSPPSPSLPCPPLPSKPLPSDFFSPLLSPSLPPTRGSRLP